jgi:AAA family ATP:ADP antiporter
MDEKKLSTNTIFPTILHKIFGISSIILLILSFFNKISYILIYLGIQCNLSYLNISVEIVCWIILLISSFRYWFPIEPNERKKVLFLSTAFFTNICIYTLARILKDVALVGGLGSRGSTFAKVLILLYSITYGAWYKKIAKKISLKKLLFIASIPSIGYFLLYCFILSAPSIEAYVLPSASFISKLDNILSFSIFSIQPLRFFGGFIDLFKIWPTTIFYIIAEMWGVTLTLTFFWQMANSTVLNTENKRFYPVILLIAQFAQLLAGNIGESYNKSPVFIPICGLVIGVLSIIMVLSSYVYLNLFPTHQVNKPKHTHLDDVSITTLIKQGKWYMLYVAILSIAYGIFCSGFENPWKEVMKQSGNYGACYSAYIIMQGRLSILLSIFGSQFFSTCAWIISGLSTPIIGLSGLLFFYLYYILSTSFGITFGVEPKSAIMVIIWTGAFTIALSKACKYILFDRSKEEYIRVLPSHDAINAKSIEGQYAKIGKSGFALLNCAVIGIVEVFTGKVASYLDLSMMIYLFVFTTIICIIWIFCVKKMNTIVQNPEIITIV